MDNLKGAVILVTGATGYIGSHVTRRLVKEGCTVHVIVRQTSDRTQLKEAREKIAEHLYDGTYESIERAISTALPDIVIHLSAFATITYQSNDIEKMIVSNILLGTFLAEAMANHQVYRFINTSSYSQHVNHESYQPNSLYAATKQAFEDILQYYSRSSLMNILSLVLFDNFGPDDPRPKIMNLLYRTMTDGKRLVMSPGEQQLDLLYINDVVNAYVVAATRLMNVGPSPCHERFAISCGQRIKLKDLVRLFEQISECPLEVEWGGIDYRPGEIMTPWNQGNILPGWSPSISVEEGIRLFISENQRKK